MKVISKKELIYDADRLGVKKAIIQIDLTVEKRDDFNKMIRLKSIDSILINHTRAIEIGGDFQSYVVINENIYEKSYDEYEAQRNYLLSLDQSGLTGLELEDKLLQDALMLSLQNDPIYEAAGYDWERR